MPKRPNISDGSAELRRCAEARLSDHRKGRRSKVREQNSEADSARLLHELEVHQIELEMQNAEVQKARDELEVALEKYTDLYDFAPAGYFSLDESGVILEANLTGAMLLGVERSRLINRRLLLFVSETSRPVFLAFLKKLFTGHEDQICEALLLNEGGGTFWASVRATLSVCPKGARKWCRVAISDIAARKQAEAALRESERRYREMINALPVAIYTTDAEGRLTHFNPTAVEFSGRTPELGADKWCITWKMYRPDGRRLPHDKSPMAVALKEGRFVRGEEFIAERPDGKRIWFTPYPSPLRDAEGRVVGGVNMLVDITERKRAAEASRRAEVLAASNRKLKREIARRQTVEKALRISERHHAQLLEQSRQMQEQLRLLSRQLLSAQEEERKKISRELHDVIAQTLTSINLRLSALRKEAALNTKGLERSIARTQQLVEHSVKIVHRFARELRPTVLDDLGLIPALHTFMKGFKEETGIHVSLSAFAAVEQVNGDKRTVLYRVAQEALTNVARHAQASRAEVKIQKLDGAVCLRIKDNGKGFPAERVLHAKKNKRLGLLGMRERVEMVNGSFAIESAPGKGTTIRAQIPFGSRRAGRAENSRRIN